MAADFKLIQKPKSCKFELKIVSQNVANNSNYLNYIQIFDGEFSRATLSQNRSENNLLYPYGAKTGILS